jgi:hypothetical protein
MGISRSSSDVGRSTRVVRASSRSYPATLYLHLSFLFYLSHHSPSSPCSYSNATHPQSSPEAPNPSSEWRATPPSWTLPRSGVPKPPRRPAVPANDVRSPLRSISPTGPRVRGTSRSTVASRCCLRTWARSCWTIRSTGLMRVFWLVSDIDKIVTGRRC